MHYLLWSYPAGGISRRLGEGGECTVWELYHRVLPTVEWLFVLPLEFLEGLLGRVVGMNGSADGPLRIAAYDTWKTAGEESYRALHVPKQFLELLMGGECRAAFLPESGRVWECGVERVELGAVERDGVTFKLPRVMVCEISGGTSNAV